MKALTKKLFPLWLLASLGIMVNSAYYYDSFDKAGYFIFFAISLSISFMLFEAVLYLYQIRKRYIPFLKASLIIFSIFITLGSQFFSTSEKSAKTEKIIYDELNISEDIQYLRDQIGIQTDLIKSYTRSQENDFIFTLTEEKQKTANDKVKGYEAEIKLLQANKSTAVQKINKPESIYYFYAVRIPNILKGDSKEELIRVLFQLFSSVLLALMAPIAFSLIKSITEGEKLTRSDKKTILSMLLHSYPDVMSPERAVNVFETIKINNPNKKAYSFNECKEIYDDIEKKGLLEADKKDIIKGVLNG